MSKIDMRRLHSMGEGWFILCLAKEKSKEHNAEVSAICKKYASNGNPRSIKNIEDTKSLIDELNKLS